MTAPTVTYLGPAHAPAQAVPGLARGGNAKNAANPAGAPTQAVPEIARPREEILLEMARLLATRRGDPARIEGYTNPDDPDAGLYDEGALLPSPHATLAGPTFEQWLDSKNAGGSRSSEAAAG